MSLVAFGPDYSRSGQQLLHIHSCRCDGGIQAVFCHCGLRAPSPPLTDRVVMSSGGETKGVGIFAEQLMELPPGPVAGEFDNHPASKVIWPAERSTISSPGGEKIEEQWLTTWGRHKALLTARHRSRT